MAAASAVVSISAPRYSRELRVFSPILTLSGTPSRCLLRFRSEQPRDFIASKCSASGVSSSSSPPLVSAQFFSTSSAGGWADFAEKISGEWDGFGADFTTEGKPINLPESVVPEAFREWEVEVFDWQTQCPTLAQSLNNSPSLMYKTIKLLPTVGCEADAATRYSTLERNVGPGHDSPFAYQSAGSYVALWPNTNTNELFDLEHCLLNPNDKESRIRVIQAIGLQQSELKLRGITVFIEQWYGPFRNGDQLGGCAIRDSAFAATEPLDASQVSGVWQASCSSATFSNTHKMIQPLGEERVYQSKRNVGDLILLPKQFWCSVSRAENGETCCEVGWLLNQGLCITSKCTFSSTAKLQEIAIARETAVPA